MTLCIPCLCCLVLERGTLTKFVFQPLTLLQRDDQWAYKMYDASAKVPRTGLISGHQHFPGNFDSCLEIATKDFTGKHCLNLGLPDAGILDPGQMDAWEHFKSRITKHILAFSQLST